MKTPSLEGSFQSWNALRIPVLLNKYVHSNWKRVKILDLTNMGAEGVRKDFGDWNALLEEIPKDITSLKNLEVK